MATEIIIFIKSNKLVFGAMFLAILYGIIYSFDLHIVFKYQFIDERFNAILLNVATSIFASGVFYIVQVYYPQRKKSKLLSKYLKEHLKKLKNKIEIYMETISKIEKSGNPKDEEEEYYKLVYCYNSIDQIITAIFNQYYDILSLEILDALNALLLNDFYLNVKNITLKKEKGNYISTELLSIPKDWEKLKNIFEIINKE